MILLDGETLTPDLLHEIALGARVQIHPNNAWMMRSNAETTPAGSSILAKKRRWLIGDHAEGMDDDALARAFIVGHCTGVGDPLPDTVVRAAIAARVNVLAQGASGCRAAAAGILLAMLNNNVTPRVPAQGSVGAAGDLAPMAHIAAVACGYLDKSDALPAFTPTPKEALALINGVSLTTALAAIAVVRARRVMESAIIAAAMTMEVVRADTRCIDPRALGRTHAGAGLVGRRLRELLAGSTLASPDRDPDAFSIRCTPQVMGAVWRTLSFSTVEVRNELNAVSDNPLLIDGEWVEAGNFHGASVAMAMDHLKVAIAQLATLSERRTFRLTHGQLSKGLPSFLVEGTGLNSGFMLAQYTAASLASECKTLSHPASVDTIPTVQHHEDHVSMGPIAARGALRMVECVADIVGIELMLAAQGLNLRQRAGAVIAPKIAEHLATIRESIDFWPDDQLMHPDIASAGRLVREGRLLGEGEAKGW
ncbi:MAG: aromatic amino acid lyase [Myxococcota bacterium]|nr:aromatic amino acid lyase [Myxococcota bacterium]